MDENKLLKINNEIYYKLFCNMYIQLKKFTNQLKNELR